MCILPCLLSQLVVQTRDLLVFANLVLVQENQIVFHVLLRFQLLESGLVVVQNEVPEELDVVDHKLRSWRAGAVDLLLRDRGRGTGCDRRVVLDLVLVLDVCM